MMGKDFENTYGHKTPKGETKMMSAVLDGAVFPGTQGGPLEHVIAAKAVAYAEAIHYYEDLTPVEELERVRQVAATFQTGKRLSKIGRPTKKNRRDLGEFLD